MLITVLGHLFGFAFLCLMIYLIINSRKNHPERFLLEEGEEIIKMAKGDYWKRENIFQDSQKPGEFAFTNKRIMFKCSGLVSSKVELEIPFGEIKNFLKSDNKKEILKNAIHTSSSTDVSIPYEEIAYIKKSFVMIFPVAFTVVTKDNKEYKFAIMKRHIYMDLISSLAKECE